MNKFTLLFLGVSLLFTYVTNVEGTRREKLAYVTRSLVGKHLRTSAYRAKYSFYSLIDAVGHQTGAFV